METRILANKTIPGYKKSAVCIIVLFLLASSEAQTMTNTHDLLTTLMAVYDKNVRPAEDQSQPVYVNASFELVAIQEFEEVSEKLSTVGVMTYSWKDPRMRWNPFLYNHTYLVNLAVTDVWKPDILLGNPIDKVNAIGQDWMKVKYLYDGTAYWSPADVYHSTCKVDVTYFPFDIQTCQLIFLTWGSLASEVMLQAEGDTAQLTFFNENGEWELQRTSVFATARPSDPFSLVMVELRIKRRPTFFLVNVILPIIFMGFLNVLVFVLPVESGERMSFVITVLLAIAVFLTLVSDNMPKTSQPMSSLCYFLVINLIASTVICCTTIFNLSIYYKDYRKPVPKWLELLTKKLRCMKSRKMTKVHDISPELDEMTVATVDGKLDVKRTVSGDKKPIPYRWAEKALCETDDSQKVTWRQVSRMLDIVFGVTSLVWLMASSVSFMVMVANHEVPAAFT